MRGRVGEVIDPTKHARASSGQDGLTPICPFVQGQAELHDSDAYITATAAHKYTDWRLGETRGQLIHIVRPWDFCLLGFDMLV